MNNNTLLTPPPKPDANKNRQQENNLSLQSSIVARTVLADDISKHIRNLLNQKLECRISWELLFSNKWNDQMTGLKSVGSGSYGSVYIVTLRKYPDFPIALKRTNNMELEEAKYTLLAGTLSEAGISPHFPILYAHLHCEKLNDSTLKKNFQAQLIPWNQGARQIQEINLEIEQQQQLIQREQNNPQNQSLITKHNEHIGILRNKAMNIYKLMYADDETVDFFRKLRDDKERKFQDQYSTVSFSNKNDKIYQNDLKIIEELKNMYLVVQRNREKYHKPFEMMLLEMADHKFSEWVKNDSLPSAKDIISASFQVCSGLLSFVSFFKLVQNDLHLHNIMYSNVHPSVYYVYKIGSSYFRVPLRGKLMKIIDFGLTTDLTQFHQPPKPGKGDSHWCEGGRGIGPSEQRQCSFFVRDILEYFYHLHSKYNWNGNIGRWIKMAYTRARDIERETLEEVVGLILYVFSPSTLELYGLPTIIEKSEKPFKMDPLYQQDYFDVMNKKKYHGKITQIIQNKVWQG
jgi:hypothetical protein